MKVYLVCIVTLALGFGLGWALKGPRQWFGCHRGHHDHGRGPGLERLLEDAQVTPDQRQAIVEVDAQFRERIAKARENLEEKRRAFEAGLASEQDEAALRPLFEELDGAKHQGEEVHFAMMMKVRSLLTLEQRQRLHALRHERPMRGGRGEP